MTLDPECYHAYLRRRVDRLYYLTDVLGKRWFLPELQRRVRELERIERKG